MASEARDLSSLITFPTRAGAAVRDLSKPMKQCEVLVTSAVRSGFQSGTSPDGSAWKPLAHARPRGAGKPLYDTGRLLASIKSKLTGRELTVGTTMIYAALHQYGGTVTPKRAKMLAIPLSSEASRHDSPRRMEGLHRRGRALFDSKGTAHWALVASVTIPARPFLGFGEKVIGQIVRIFERFLTDAVGGAIIR